VCADYAERHVRQVHSEEAQQTIRSLSGHKAVHYPYLPAARHEKLHSVVEYVPPPSACPIFKKSS
jgi:hypothetical protein